MSNKTDSVFAEIGVLILIIVIIYYDRKFDFKLGLLIGIFITMIIIDFTNSKSDNKMDKIIDVKPTENTEVSVYEETEIVRKKNE